MIRFRRHFSPRCQLPSITLSFLFLIALGVAASANDLEKQLDADYANKTLTLRRFYEGDHLRFFADGRVVGDHVVGPWTLDGQIAVKELKIKGNLLEIKGRRVHVAFFSVGKTQLIMGHPLPDKHGKDLEEYLKSQDVAVEIELSTSKPTRSDLDAALHGVFIMPGDSMIDVVPPYWRKYFATLEGKPAPTPEGQVYRVTSPKGSVGEVSAPHGTYQPNPEYTEEARKAKFQGAMVLWLVVGPDGSTRDIQIERPLGLGLDEKAVAAAGSWKFDPATKDGEPVAAIINVRVDFRLY